MNELTIVNPAGNLEIAQGICHAIVERKREILADFDTVEVTDDNWKSPELKAKVESLAAAVKDLRERGKQLVKDVVSATEAQRILTQIDSRLWSYSTKGDPESAYYQLSTRLKELKAKIAEMKEKNSTPLPKHTYVIKVTATDKAFVKALEAIEKEGCEDVAYAAAQSDKAVKQLIKWFDENTGA